MYKYFSLKSFIGVFQCKCRLNMFFVLQVSYFKHFLMTNYHQILQEYQVLEME